MRQRIITALITIGVIVVLAAAAGLFVIFSGAYDVAATEPHWGITHWALGTLQRNSVAARAGAVQGAPPTDSAALAHGFEHFHAMCVQCHGAPGIDRGELGQGMLPAPPRLEEEARDWSDAELFRITKHGIRLAGMPAFGPTHSDAEIWAIVGFIRQLEEMTEEVYAERVRAMQSSTAGDGDGHSDPPGTADHEH
jgi:mono/diheme cytochrome c family protein